MSSGNLETSVAEVQRRFERIMEGFNSPCARDDQSAQVQQSSHRAASWPALASRPVRDDGEHPITTLWGVEGPQDLSARRESANSQIGLDAAPNAPRARSVPPSSTVLGEFQTVPNNTLTPADMTFGNRNENFVPPAANAAAPPSVSALVAGTCSGWNAANASSTDPVLRSASPYLETCWSPSTNIESTANFGRQQDYCAAYADVENSIGDVAEPLSYGAADHPYYGSTTLANTADMALKLHSKSDRLFVDASDALRVFASTFTFFCFAIFALPVWITFHVGQDKNVQEWIIDRLWLIIYLFFVYLVVHVVHFIKGGPNKVLVSIVLLGSCALLLVAGDYVILESFKLSNAFAAQDCDSFAEKREMEVEWEAARVFYVDCMHDLARDRRLSLNLTMARYKIEDCPNYAQRAATVHQGWTYLGYLEEAYQCSGWCEERPPLWTFATTRDSCSAAVASVLSTTIQWSMIQVVVYTIVVLGFVSALLLSAGPVLQKHGVSW